MKRSLTLALAAAALAVAANAAAQTLYKLIDKNGKVTYSEKPPKDFDGKVVPMNIDPNANTATLPKPTGPLLRPEARPEAREAERANVQAARDKVAAARKALQDARDNPAEGEIERVGKAGGGTRPVESEGYQKRLADLQENLRRAEEELRVAEGR
jgi:hypothetical protein